MKKAKKTITIPTKPLLVVVAILMFAVAMVTVSSIRWYIMVANNPDSCYNDSNYKTDSLYCAIVNLVYPSEYYYEIHRGNIIIQGADKPVTILQGADKPVIYLYPTQQQEVKVNLDFNGKLNTTYPNYGNGWDVIANPNGSLVNKLDGQQYSYLFWEGTSNISYGPYSDGFVVKGSDTAKFLQVTLAKMGLTPKEYNEMIVYWLPKMQNNAYNLIHFAGSEYTDNAKLTITPKPDSMLRVFMTYHPLTSYRTIPAQKINTFDRHGFAVVEWGGSEV